MILSNEFQTICHKLITSRRLGDLIKRKGYLSNDDFVCDVMANAWRFTPKSKLALTTIAWKHITWCLAGSQSATTELEDLPAPEGPDVIEASDFLEFALGVNLTPSERTVLQCRYAQNLTFREISELTSFTRQGIVYLLNQAYKKIRKQHDLNRCEKRSNYSGPI
jgi:DNA-directed RNA polymerase specialized sigma24 family protein